MQELELNNEYDIVIVGAGIAGLIIANELVVNNKICILEKNNELIYKSWLTKKSIIMNSKYDRYILSEFKKYYFDASMYDLKSFVTCNYVSVSHKDLMKDLEKRFVERKGTILYNHQCIDSKIINDGILAKTNSGDFKAKLIIDCSGFDSVLGLKNKLYDNSLFFHIYGEIFEGALKDEEINMLGTYQQTAPLKLFQAVPASKDKTVMYSFTLGETIGDIKELQRDAQINLKTFNEKNNRNFSNPLEIVSGIIPLGDVKNTASDRLFFFGDSSNIAPCFSGVGFSLILKSASKISQHLSNCINNNELDKTSLNVEWNDTEKLTRAIHKAIAKLLSKLSPEDFNKLIKYVVDGMPAVLIDKIYFGPIRRKDFLRMVQYITFKRGALRCFFGILKKYGTVMSLKDFSKRIYRAMKLGEVLKKHKI